MDIISGLLVYFLIWWMVLFCTLPLGVKRNTGSFEGSGAPEKPDLKKKILITSGVSLLVWVFVFGMIKAGYLDFRADSMKMIEETNNEN